MAVFPARALCANRGCLLRQGAIDARFGQDDRRLAGQSQIDAKLHVLDDIAAGELNFLDERPRQRHASSRQMAQPCQPNQSERPHQVFEAKGKPRCELATARHRSNPDTGPNAQLAVMLWP